MGWRWHRQRTRRRPSGRAAGVQHGGLEARPREAHAVDEGYDIREVLVDGGGSDRGEHDRLVKEGLGVVGEGCVLAKGDEDDVGVVVDGRLEGHKDVVDSAHRQLADLDGASDVAEEVSAVHVATDGGGECVGVVALSVTRPVGFHHDWVAEQLVPIEELGVNELAVVGDVMLDSPSRSLSSSLALVTGRRRLDHDFY